MYHHFFGLREPAFAIAVNPRYLYMSEQHREALAHLLFGLQGGGFVQLTGEVGTGKTTIIRCLLEQLPDNTDIALVLNPMASVPELLSSICDELGARYIDDQPTTKTLTDALYNQLLDNHTAGRNTVLLIDEAQSLSAEALEQVRLLTNLETNTQKLLNIILVGQPELNDVLAQPSLRQLAQRITARFHLQPLSSAEARAYIEHRLQVAGMEPGRALMPEALIQRVHAFSGGIPRLINIICERMLLGAYGQNRPQLDDGIFEQAQREILGKDPAAKTEEQTPASEESPGAHPAPPIILWRRLWPYGLAAGIVGLTLGAALVGLVNKEHSTLPGEPTGSRVESRPTLVAVPELLTPALADRHSADQSQALQEPAALTLADDSKEESQPRQSAKQDTWPWELTRAQRALADHLQLDVPEEGDPCPASGEPGHHCFQDQLDTWNDLMALNQPVLLTLITPERKQVYAPLLGLNPEQALVLNDQEPQLRTWRELAQLWTGEVHYYSFRPEGFESALSPGTRGAAVTWLAQQFAQLDGESSPLAQERYNLPLQSRVEIFQRHQQLETDGIFGLNTLVELNRALGLTPALSDPEHFVPDRLENEVASDLVREAP